MASQKGKIRKHRRLGVNIATQRICRRRRQKQGYDKEGLLEMNLDMQMMELGWTQITRFGISKVKTRMETFRGEKTEGGRQMFQDSESSCGDGCTGNVSKFHQLMINTRVCLSCELLSVAFNTVLATWSDVCDTTCTDTVQLWLSGNSKSGLTPTCLTCNHNIKSS